MEGFFRTSGLGTRLADLGIKDDRLQEMAGKCTGQEYTHGRQFRETRPSAVLQILSLAR